MPGIGTFDLDGEHTIGDGVFSSTRRSLINWLVRDDDFLEKNEDVADLFWQHESQLCSSRPQASEEPIHPVTAP